MFDGIIDTSSELVLENDSHERTYTEGANLLRRYHLFRRSVTICLPSYPNLSFNMSLLFGKQRFSFHFEDNTISRRKSEEHLLLFVLQIHCR